MRDLDAVARRLHQAVKDLTPAVPKAPAPAPALTPAPAPVAVEKKPDYLQEAVFERDDFDQTTRVVLHFSSGGAAEIIPHRGSHGLMESATFSRLPT